MNRTPQALALIALSLLAAPALAQDASADWCRDARSERDRHCEVREYTLQPRDGALAVDVGPNGGIQVEGWSGTEIRVLARIQTRSGSEAAAAELADEVEVLTSAGELRADGPRTRGRESWSVSVRVQVPVGTRLDLRSTNGGINVRGTEAAVTARTTNGSIQLAGVSGPIMARSTNGGIRASLAGSLRLQDDIELRTTNGSIDLGLPDGISARIEASTTNGGISTDFPITVQGRMGRQLSGVLGDGGAEIRATTTNGAVRLTRN